MHTVFSGSEEEKETIDLIFNSSIFQKIMYIVENGQSNLLNNPQYKNANWLNDLCLHIMDTPHLIPYKTMLLQSDTYTKAEVMMYIANNPVILNWVIDNVLFDTFRIDINAVLGNQDITELWKSITSQKRVTIDGINPEHARTLRESCDVCSHIRSTYCDEWLYKDCHCLSYSSLYKVWVVSENSFSNALTQTNAMLYRTNSLDLYLQTVTASRTHDVTLRKAWLIWAKPEELTVTG